MEKNKQKKDPKRSDQDVHKRSEEALHTGSKKLDGPDRPST